MFRFMLIPFCFMPWVGGCIPQTGVCCDNLSYYKIKAILVDAQSSVPLADAEVTVCLYRDGMPLRYRSRLPRPCDNNETDEEGKLRHIYHLAIVGSCAPRGTDPWPCAIEKPLEDLPNQIEFSVELADGRSGNITLPLQESNFTEIEEAFCVPVTAVIELGQVSISID